MYQEKTLTQRSAKRVLKTYGQLLKQKKIPVEKMILFGSFAKNNYSKWSDIDVVVISTAFSGNNKTKREDQLWDLREKIDLRISPLAYSPQDWAEEISIKDDVQKNGIEINF